MAAPIHLAIAHQSILAIDLFIIALRQIQGYHVMFTSTSGPELIRKFNTGPGIPSILIFDSSLCLNGCDVHLELKSAYPALKTVISASYEDEDQAIRFIQQGANAYVPPESGLKGILAAIRDVLTLGYYDNEAMKVRKYKERLKPYLELTPKDIQVMRLLALSEEKKHIAEKVKMTERGVERYRDKLYDRLRIHDRPHLLGFCIRYGIITAHDLGGRHGHVALALPYTQIANKV